LLSVFSLIILLSDFWSSLFTNILAGVLLTLMGWLAWRLKRIVQHLLKASSPYRINGIWIGLCKLPRHPADVEAIEIYHLNRRDENITLRFFHYRPDEPKITRYEGAGIYRGEVLSAFYYIAEAEISESGVFVCHKVGEIFKGVYAQYDLSLGMKLYQSPENFILRRIQISLWPQVRMILGRAPFPRYDNVKRLYDKALAKQPNTAS